MLLDPIILITTMIFLSIIVFLYVISDIERKKLLKRIKNFEMRITNLEEKIKEK